MATTKHEAAIMGIAELNQLLSELLLGQHKISWNIRSENDLLEFYIYASFHAKHQSHGEIVNGLDRSGREALSIIQTPLQQKNFKLTYLVPSMARLGHQLDDYTQEYECSVSVAVIEVRLEPQHYNAWINSLRQQIMAHKKKPVYTETSTCLIQLGWVNTITGTLDIHGKYSEENPKFPQDIASSGYWSLINGLAGYHGQTRYFLNHSHKRQRIRLNILRMLKGQIGYQGEKYSFNFQLLCNTPSVWIRDALGNDCTSKLMAVYSFDHAVRRMSADKIVSMLKQRLVRGAKIEAYGAESEMRDLVCSNYAPFQEIILCIRDLRIHVTAEGLSVFDKDGGYLREQTAQMNKKLHNSRHLSDIFKSSNRMYALHVLNRLELVFGHFMQFYFL